MKLKLKMTSKFLIFKQFGVGRGMCKCNGVADMGDTRDGYGWCHHTNER